MIELKFSTKLQAFIEKRRRLKKAKLGYIERQNYEGAAKVRDQLKELEQEVIKHLQKTHKKELSSNGSFMRDMWTLFDFVEPGETSFDEAFKRMSPVNMEKIQLLKKIEKYKNGDISLDELNENIKQSFKNVVQDIKNKILSLE